MNEVATTTPPRGELSVQVELARAIERLAHRLENQAYDLETALFGSDSLATDGDGGKEPERPAQPYVLSLGQAHETALKTLERANKHIAEMLLRL
jgi:hypothetical protein